MRTCLVVANQTLGGEHLMEELRKRVASGPCRFFVLVPATRPPEHATWKEEEARAVAAARLDAALLAFRGAGPRRTVGWATTTRCWRSTTS